VPFPLSCHPVHLLNFDPESFREFSRRCVEERIHSDPYSLIPCELAVAMTPEGAYVDSSMMHRIRMFNVGIFDRLTANGYKLNLVEGRFEKK